MKAFLFSVVVLLSASVAQAQHGRWTFGNVNGAPYTSYNSPSWGFSNSSNGYHTQYQRSGNWTFYNDNRGHSGTSYRSGNYGGYGYGNYGYGGYRNYGYCRW